jgi:hypothetical protein
MKSIVHGRLYITILLGPSRIVGTGSSKEEVDFSFEYEFDHIILVLNSRFEKAKS